MEVKHTFDRYGYEKAEYIGEENGEEGYMDQW
jgi:hypothetical protein